MWDSGWVTQLLKKFSDFICLKNRERLSCTRGICQPQSIFRWQKLSNDVGTDTSSVEGLANCLAFFGVPLRFNMAPDEMTPSGLSPSAHITQRSGYIAI